MITVEGTDNPQYQTEAAPGRDEWDTWNDDRDHRIESAQSWQKTDPYYTGIGRSGQERTGAKSPTTAKCGLPTQSRTGRLIAMAAGFGNLTTAGRGFPTSPGAGRRITMAAGSSMAATGRGGRGLSYGYPGYYPVWAPAYVSFFGFGGGGFGIRRWIRIRFRHASAGCPSGRATGITRGTADGVGRGAPRRHSKDINGLHQGFGPLAGERGFGGTSSRMSMASYA